MKNKLFKVLSVAALSAMFIIPQIDFENVFANATSNQIKQNENKQVYVQQQLAATQRAIQQLNSQAGEVEQEIMEIDLLIVQVEQEIAVLEEKIANADATIEQVNYEKSVLANNLAYAKKKFEETTAHLTGGGEYLDYINSAENSDSLNYRIELLKNAYEVYQSAVEKYEQEFTYANAKEGTAKIEKAQLEKDKQIVLNKKAFVDEQSNKKKEKLMLIHKDMDSHEDAHYELEAMSNEIENLIVDLQNELKRENATYTVKWENVDGKLHWPSATSNRMTSQFGHRIDPITGKKGALHQGLDIGAAKGTGVLAAENGRVITSGWINGYGNVVMIDHGKGMVTVYGHNSKLTAKIGQEVKRGEKIAEVGSTGRSTGNHIHFEVRIDGKAVNPLPYLQ